MGKYNKIYVLAPYNYATGGVELSHQLVDYLRQKNNDAYIVYIRNGKIFEDQTVTPAYSCYNILTTKIIEDTPSNILILPELYFDFIYNFSNIQLGCWWMSVDNRYKCCSFSCRFKYLKSYVDKSVFLLKYILGRFTSYKNSDTDLLKFDNRIVHFYQSRYAQHHLYSLGVSRVLPLSDYINTEFIGELNMERNDVVLYNPSKGVRFTQKLIASLPSVTFVPLRGLSRKELKELMQTSKLYIDFGEFPGKDRLPREAILNGLCILTGKLGASLFYEDVSIDNRYKFETKSASIPGIVDKIQYILNHFEECVKDFSFYKERILKEKELFYKEIEEAFLQD